MRLLCKVLRRARGVITIEIHNKGYPNKTSFRESIIERAIGPRPWDAETTSWKDGKCVRSFYGSEF